MKIDTLNLFSEPPIIHVQDSIIDELLPRPAACKVLRQINHAAMIHGGDHPDIKEDRIVLENALGLYLGSLRNSNALGFVIQHLIRYLEKFATVYSGTLSENILVINYLLKNYLFRGTKIPLARSYLPVKSTKGE